jgi:hypothetical protein
MVAVATLATSVGLGAVAPLSVLASDAVVMPTADGSNTTAALTVRGAVASLPVAAEATTGYQRGLFAYGVDADGDGCRTRAEVLIAEAIGAPVVSSACAVTGASWYSYYDGQTYGDAALVEIDHLVPLAEAWRSGANGWTPATRQAFANDVADPRTLAVVGTPVNRAKGDQDVAQWLPPSIDAHCRYLHEWVAVKTRWKLSADATEKAALQRLAGACADTALAVSVAATGSAGQAATFHFDGYGPLLIGMTEQQALAASPVPLVAYLQTGTPSGDSGCTFYAERDIVDRDGDVARGVQVTVKDGLVVAIDAFLATTARTDRGIRRGSTVEEVLAAYPEPHTQGPSHGGAVLAVTGPGGHDLGFALDDAGETVIGIGVGNEGYRPGMELCGGPDVPPFDTGLGDNLPID